MTPADINLLADAHEGDSTLVPLLRALADVVEQAKESAKHWGCTEELAEALARVADLKL